MAIPYFPANEEKYLLFKEIPNRIFVTGRASIQKRVNPSLQSYDNRERNGKNRCKIGESETI